MNRKATHGFTLVEVLVALFVLAIISIGAFQGLNAVINARDTVTRETRTWQQLMFLFSRMELDFALAIPRAVRGPNGQDEPEWIGRPAPLAPDEGQVVLTRAGGQGEAGAVAGPQRIGYRLEHGTLYLLRWAALDSPPDARPLRYALLHHVSEFQLRYLDERGVWREQWPLPGHSGIPAAVEVRLTLEGGQPITRLFLTR